MDVPPLTEELAHRLDQAAVAWSRAWMDGIAAVELGSFAPHVLAPCHPSRPDLDFQNRVNGLRPTDASLVPLIVDWYAERGVRPWFELVPSDDAGDLLAALAAAGAVPIGFHGVVHGPAAPPPASAARALAPDLQVDVVVVDSADADAFATFRRVRTEAHELPPGIRDEAAADLGGWRHAAGATLYLATVAGVPAATAALTVDRDSGIAYLADGATVPAFRGRGLQSLLIGRRLVDGAAAGATVSASQASFGTTSHRNLQRAGLTGGFTKLVLRTAGR